MLNAIVKSTIIGACIIFAAFLHATIVKNVGKWHPVEGYSSIIDTETGNTYIVESAIKIPQEDGEVKEGIEYRLFGINPEGNK